MSRPENPLYYRLDLQDTADSTGYIAAVPPRETTFEQGLSYLCRHLNASLPCRTTTGAGTAEPALAAV